VIDTVNVPQKLQELRDLGFVSRWTTLVADSSLAYLAPAFGTQGY